MFGSGEVWGITIGGTSLRAVKMALDGEQASVLEAEIVPYASGEDLDHEVKVRQALQALAEKHKMARQTVAISIPGSAVFSKFITLPPVETKRVPEIVKYESRQQIPFPIEEVVWDYQPVKAEPLPGEEIEVALFAVRREIIQAYLASCESVGIVPTLVQTSPLALCNFLQNDQPSEEPLVVLDVGVENTELLIIDGERTWPRNIGVGTQNLTNALMKKFQISREKAEELRAQAAKAKQADRLFGVMKPELQNLSGQVQRTLGFYKSQHPEVRFSKVILAGEFFDIPGVEGFFKEALRYEFSRLAKPSRVEIEDGARAAFETQAADLAVPTGLGLQALGLARIRVNLVLPELVQARQQAAKRPWVAAAVVMLGAAVGADFFQAMKDLEAANTVTAEVQAKTSEIDGVASKLDAAKKAPQPLEKELAQLPGLLMDRETGLPSRVFSDTLRLALAAVPVNEIWVEELDIHPVQVKDLGLTQEALPSALRGGKEKDKRWVLRVGLRAQKVKGDSQSQDLETIKKTLVDALRRTPWFVGLHRDWISPNIKDAQDLEGRKFEFTVEWFVNPEAYPAAEPPAAPAS